MKDKESFFSISIFTPYCFKKEFSENYFHSNKVLSSRQAIFIEITSMGWCVDYHALETKSHIITIYIQHKIKYLQTADARIKGLCIIHKKMIVFLNYNLQQTLLGSAVMMKRIKHISCVLREIQGYFTDWK